MLEKTNLKPEAVLWPNPAHEKYPLNKFKLYPYLHKTKIMNRHTPIGLAGSCFAAKIARFLQRGVQLCRPLIGG